MRVAYFSPLNPQPSGISDYSEELLPHLAAGAEIELFVDGFAPSNAALVSRFPVHEEVNVGARRQMRQQLLAVVRDARRLRVQRCEEG